MNMLICVISLYMLVISCYIPEALCDNLQQQSDSLKHDNDAETVQEEQGSEYGNRADLIYSSYQNFMGGGNHKVVLQPEPNELPVLSRVARNAKDGKTRRGGKGGRRRDRRIKKNRTSRAPILSTPSNLEEGNVDRNISDPTLSNITFECLPCQWRRNRKHVRLASIKDEILRKLNIVPPVNFTRPPYNISLFPGPGTSNFTDPMDSTASVEVEPAGGVTKIITFSESSNLEQFENSPDVIYFNVRPDIINSHLLEAELHIYLKRLTARPSNGAAHINIWRIIKEQNGQYTFENQPDKRHKVALNRYEEGFQKINIKHIVEKWMHSRGEQNYGLRITATHVFGNEKIAVIRASNPDEQGIKPYLWVTIEAGKSRNRRHGGYEYDLPQDCDDISEEERCCRYPLDVNFEDFGWNWMIIPKRYSAYYCSGLCQFPNPGHTPHSTLVNFARDSNQRGGPCCTPVKLSPISLLYFDQDSRVVLSTLDNMVADKCGCN